MGLSKEDRVLLYTKMYTAVSKATAETKNAKGEAIKVTYNGRIADLFDGICSNGPTIRAFMWAITHKTDALPTALFRVIDHGVKGSEISRIHSGFYDDQRNHIIGTALIPFIMDAMKLWEPKPRDKKEALKVYPIEARMEDEVKKDMLIGKTMNVDSNRNVYEVLIEQLSDDQLAHFGKCAQERYDRAKADLDEYHIEIQRREQEREKIAKKQELLKTISELIKGEGFTLDEIMQIV